MRALIIDDSRAMRAILGKFLSQLGFEITEARHGREGLDLLKEMLKPDLVVVDWNMPEMDGLAFVRAVREDPSYQDIRLVMITTETEVSQVATALEAGADEYVMKPFTRDVLQEKLGLLGFGSS